MIRSIAAMALVLVATAALYGFFYEAALFDYRLQLVVFEPSMDPHFRQHGKPTVGPLGVLSYSIGCAIHAALVLAALRLTDWRLRRWLLAAVLMFVTSAVVIVVLDPYFLGTVLPEAAWLAYLDAVRRVMPPLHDIYTHWAFGRHVASLVVIHSALVYSVMALYSRYGEREGEKGGL